MSDLITLTQKQFDAEIANAKAALLEELAAEHAARSTAFFDTMKRMAGERGGYTPEDITRYGAYSAEANSTAAKLEMRAASVRES